MKLKVQKQKWAMVIISFLCGFVFVNKLCGMNVMETDKPECLSVMTLLVCVIAYLGYLYWRDYQCNIWVMLFAFAVTCVGIVGYLLRVSGGSGVFEFYLRSILLCGITGMSAVSWLICKAFDKLTLCREDGCNQRLFRKYFWFYFAFILLAWIPVYLAYYPGIFAYDVHTQINMLKRGAYTTHHPLLHTLLLQLFYVFGERVGSYNAGIASYTILQMVIMALALAYALWYLYTRGVKKMVRIIILFFFAFCPINSLLAISDTKDTLFSAAVLLFVIQVLQFLENEEMRRSKAKWCGFVGSGIMVFLLRNNAKYAMLVWVVIFMLVLFRKKMERKGKRVGMIMAVAILLIAQLVNTLMIHATNATHGSINEVLSIPSAQIARCYAFKNDEMSQEMLQDIAQLGIAPGDYVLPTVDIVKGRILIEGQEAHFFDVWWRLFRQYTGVCIDAFLYVNQGNISLDDISNAHVYGASLEGRMGYLITDTAKGYGVEHRSLFPQLENVYEKLFSINEYQGIPFFSTIFVPAFYFWMLMLCMLHGILSKNDKILVVGSLLLLYYATVLLGPCCLIRYMFPLVLTSPILLAIELHNPIGER